MASTKKRITAALTATILTSVLAVPAMAAEAPDEPVRVSSYKGSTLEVGERSGLIIGPSGTDYTVTSSNSDTVAVEQVLTFWVAVAKDEGSAKITASNSAGECGSVALTVGSADPAAPEAPASGDSTGLTDNMEIRREMIRLINQTRKANEVSELPVSEALINAAQACSNRRYTWTPGITPRRKARPLLMPATPTASAITLPCSPAQPMPPNVPSTTGSTLPVTSRP